MRIYTFTIVSIFFIMNNVFAQQNPPPKAGEYACYLGSLQSNLEMQLRLNPVTNQLEYTLGQGYSSNLTPAPFNLFLDGKSSYSLTKVKYTGTYSFIPKENKLEFTGKLATLTFVTYGISKLGKYVINFKDKNYDYICELPDKSAQSSQGTVNSLNQNLTGKILTTSSSQTNSFLGKVVEFDLAKGTYNILFPDGVATENSKGEILHFDKTSRIKITDKTGSTTIKQLSDKINYNFDDFYPAISNSGEYIALTVPNKSKTGKLTDLIPDGIKLLIADRNGQTVAELNNYTQAAWMNDGRLVVVGDGIKNKGLYIIDDKFKTVKKLFDGYEFAKVPAVSPDGKTLAFSNKGEIWTINIDGTNPFKAVLGNVSNFPAWSPDGKFLAVNVLIDNASKSLLYIVNLKLVKGFYLTDRNGNAIESRNRITWLP